MADTISREAAINTVFSILCKWDTKDPEDLKNMLLLAFQEMPSTQPEWNNHTVACLLADVFGDECACNFNGIDEWLPEKCEVIDACPNPVGVACWEQYLKYRAERKTNG